MVHALDGCPDAPFVFAFGGDTPSHNMHVMDVRESAKGKINNVVINLLTRSQNNRLRLYRW